MHKLMNCILITALLINCTACRSMRGNVVPTTGPTMEQVYDSMGQQNPTALSYPNYPASDDLNAMRQTVKTRAVSPIKTPHRVASEFHKLPNPELPLYVYPHLSGQAQVPIPGYTTVVNAYPQDYYALPNE